MSFLHLFKSTHTTCVSLTKGHCNHCQIHIAHLGETTYKLQVKHLHQQSFDTTLEDTLKLLAQNNLQFQQSTSSIIQNHSLALSKLEIQVGQIVQALNNHLVLMITKRRRNNQRKLSVHIFIVRFLHEEPYTPPKPYVPPIPFPGRFVKQKHDEPPIDVLEEIVPDIVFEAFLQSSNSIEYLASHIIHKERQERHYNQVIVEIQRTILSPSKETTSSSKGTGS
ncbi:hypothetical protein DVH24_004832 [Malus domestica]|uniref:Uncharacterized protein n=1 Tax=Malus domestica TaxID=3750 RepID=A0A498IAY4_MALDO|nr:hypothetical protein DVH24_004832 [Malus domestica]